MTSEKRIVFPKNVITRKEDMDFSDDGTRFRGYSYKGVVPITYTRADGMVYCDIRFDYCGISFDDCEDLIEIADEFNGVTLTKFNMDKFVENCEKCYEFITNFHTPKATIDRLYKKIEKIDLECKTYEEKLEGLKRVKERLLNEVEAIIK